MGYKIESVLVKNFKCFDNKKFYEFNLNSNNNVIILSGPNGFGKTTFFDAVELAFSENITRFKSDIENGNTSVGKNILLNDGLYDGYIVIKLKNDTQRFITLITKISNNIKKLDIKKSLLYGIIEENISYDDLSEEIPNYNNWKSSIKEFDILNFYNEHFNIYYYVSQEESIHFLKNAISKRKDVINVLLNTDTIEENINYIENNFISKRGQGLIKNKLDNLEAERKEIISKIKSVQNDIEMELNVPYNKLLNYKDQTKIFIWDNENLSDLTIKELENCISFLHRLSNYFNDFKDHQVYKQNVKIKQFNNDNYINNFILYKNYINSNGEIDLNKIDLEIKHLSKIKYSQELIKLLESIYTSNFDTQSQIIQKIKNIEKLYPEFKNDTLHTAYDSISNLSKKLESNQKLFKEFERARLNLKSVKDSYIKNDAKCPYCCYEYENIEQLNIAFESAKGILDINNDDNLQKLQEFEKLFLEAINESLKKVKQYLEDIHNINISQIDIKLKNLENIKVDNNKKQIILGIYNIIKDSDLLENQENDINLNSAKKAINEKIKSYSNINYETNLSKYNYPELEKTLKEYVDYNKFIEQKFIDNKIKYIKKEIVKRNNIQLSNLYNQFKENYIDILKLKQINGCLNELKKFYNEELSNYKNTILENIKIPLLIYTGKILQDYQCGLGVFINNADMRFVSRGDSKEDILNTFSSGQLSAFILAFTFAMNKQYVKKDCNTLDFILIDDPIQTMDDINIASLIEVMRNDFEDKQIIISTHEKDKENYILYKFLKYGLKPDSFNVKEKLYCSN
ncbi:AAA family ATPase [uncultured Tyzzerella sp.]|uniref:AAA family ATPase n=1 Tax=uncultured Tyzzerella sp. TaxID=2321398 RepID=UPI002943B574|nr:AAA family ATPase [uncultured Tyzzerella sp.]